MNFLGMCNKKNRFPSQLVQQAGVPMVTEVLFRTSRSDHTMTDISVYTYCTTTQGTLLGTARLACVRILSHFLPACRVPIVALRPISTRTVTEASRQ